MVIKCVENALLGQAVYVQIFFFFFFFSFFFLFIFSFSFFPFFFFFPLPPSVDMKLAAEVVELGQQEVHTNSFGRNFVGLLLITIFTLCLHKTVFIASKNPPVLCLL